MIFDTDVLVWALRGNFNAGVVIDSEWGSMCSVISRMELYYGAQNKKDISDIHRILRDFTVLPLNQAIGIRAHSYMEHFAIKVNMDPMDALIAATAVENNLPLCTGNVKHFRQIPGLELRHFKA